MIDHLTYYVKRQFSDWAVPVLVELGPEKVQRHAPDRTLVISRDEPGAESFTHPTGSHNNPDARGVRMLAATARAYASSSLEGAMISDHQRECDAIVDLFLVALYDWAKHPKVRVGHCPITSAGYVPPPVSDTPENVQTTRAGVIYEVHFQVPRGVYAKAREEFALAGVRSTAKLFADPLQTVTPTVDAGETPTS